MSRVYRRTLTAKQRELIELYADDVEGRTGSRTAPKDKGAGSSGDGVDETSRTTTSTGSSSQASDAGESTSRTEESAGWFSRHWKKTKALMGV
jgi:molecular chaperone DnaJ